MPRGSTYANTSQNRSLGRVGMAMGSMPVSRNPGGSSGGSVYSGHSSSSVKTYVDNAQNRSLDRVGMEHGSMVVSKSSTSGSTQSASSKTYVDNAQNRSLGRVGMVHGSMVVSKLSTSGNARSASPQTYVDNAQNQSLGRVGMERGSMVVSKSSGNKGTTTLPISPSTKLYIDNPLNRRLGRVGKPIGTQALSKSSKGPIQLYYADTAENRRLGRAGKPRGSEPTSKGSKPSSSGSKKDLLTNITAEMYRHCISDWDVDYEDDRDDETTMEAVERAMEAIQRRQLFKAQETKRKDKKPFENYKGMRIAFSELLIDEENKIGHGGFGDVFAAKWYGMTVAVKKLRVQRVSKARLKQFDEEITLFCELDHPNVTRFFGACLSTPNICMVMEFMQGSLYDKLHIEAYEFSSENKMDIVRGTIAGLAYLHDRCLAHCDIKSSNILLNIFVDEVVTKITDFGLSIMKSDTETSTSSKNMVQDIGTPRYSAPEILNGELLNVSQMMMADVYSFGLVVFEVFSEEEPYANLSLSQLKTQVGQKGLRPDIGDIMDIEPELVNLVRRCWKESSYDRPTSEECRLCMENYEKH